MRDPLEMFQKTLQNHSEGTNLQKHLLDLVESLYKDLECERNTTESLQRQIRSLTKQDNFGVTSKFAALKADYITVKEKLTQLRNENEDLHIQLMAKDQETKQLLAAKEEEMKCFYANKLKQKDEELETKMQEVESSKQNMKQKEQQLFSEIQDNKAVSDMELNSIEENFRQQLNESNNKLKDSMHTCNVLRQELRSVKEQFNEYKRTSSEKLAELQRRLRETPSPSPTKEREEASWNNHNNNTGTSLSREDKSNRYPALNVTCKTLASSSDTPINLKKVPVYRTFPKHLAVNMSFQQNRSSTLPPLLPLKDICNTNKEAKMINRKRKLYNPDDLTYLDQTQL